MSEKPQDPARPDQAPEHSNELEDLFAFLRTHGKSILLAVIVAAAVSASILVYRNHHAGQADLASVALATAQSHEDLQRIFNDYASTPSAPAAQLALAARLFDEARYDEAKAAYEQFRAEFPDHPMVRATKLCLAQVAEAAGDPAEAQAMFEAFLAENPDSYLTALARMGQARCLQQQGLLDEARAVYEDFLAENPEGAWTPMAETNLRLVQRTIRAKERPLPPLAKAEQEEEAPAEPEPEPEATPEAGGNV